MTINALPASAVRNHMADVLAQLQKTHGPCLVTKNGKAVAALLSIDAYNRLLSDLEDRLDETDDQLIHEVEEARQQFRRKQSKPLGRLKR